MNPGVIHSEIIDDKSDTKSDYALIKSIRWIRLLAIMAVLLVCLPSTGFGTGDPLTPEERAWLNEHDGKIIVNSEAGWPPIIDTDKDGHSFGIVMDYQRLLEKKLNFKFKPDKLDSWNNFMERFRKREIDVNNNLQKNPKRTEFALFTKPYIEIPNAIIVRKEMKNALTLKAMRGMKIAVTRDFAIHDFIKENYGYLQLKPLDSDLHCLLETSTRRADAAVVNLAVASFIIEKMGISNLRVAGYAEYTNALCFASRNDWPILNRILDKGLDLITPAEKQAIYSKWISLGNVPFYKNRDFWIVTCSIAVFVITFIFLILLWNRRLKKLVQSRTDSLEKTNENLKQEIAERRKAEETLRFFKYSVESASDAIGMSTAEGQHYYQNHAFSQLFGRIGENPPATLYVNEVVGREVFKNIMSGREWTGEVQMYAADRTVLDIFLRAYSIKDNNGQVVGLVGVHNDISDRKKSELALKESETRFRTLFEQAAVGVAQIESKTGEFIRINQRYCDIVGYTEGEMISKRFQEITHPDDLQEDLSNMRKLISGEIHEFAMEKRYFRRDGSTVWVNLSVSPMWRPGQEPDYHIAVVQDITERKEAEKALSQEKERLAVTLRSIGDGVITTDTDGRLVLMNKIAEELTGWNQHEAFGKDIGEVFHIINAKTRHQCENPVEKVLKAGSIVGLANHTNLIARDGTESMIADSGAPILDAKSEIIGVVLVFRDVTDKHRIERQLQQAQKMESIGILAGGIAHDFNNMLGVITGNVSHALSQIDRGAELFDILSDVQESAKQAQALTQQLLTFAKGGAPVKKAANLNQIIRESAKFVTRGGKTRCEFGLSDNLWTVEVDAGQINQTISNLVINAGQAMPDGGIIQIQTENIVIESEVTHPADLPPGKYVKITVKDHGIGISEKHISKIFDPYFTTKQTGSGLGLATSYAIIKKHDGYMTVDSEIEKGTVFHIYLPASLKDFEKTEDMEKPMHQGHGKILVMDDQEMILKMVEKILNRMGYEAMLATDGSQAIEIYRNAYQSKSPVDLVILDLTVPGGMGGARTIAELLKIDPGVRAVVSSGYSNDPIMASYQDYGFCGIVPKPYTLSQLTEVLNNIFDKKG